MLIDEAEIHLHYDAQADLMQMFAKQNLVSKIIYTTHSIGCLPEDLGAGIRLVKPKNDGTSSVANYFWDDDRQGFSPLLFGMGASTLAFVPLRYALLTEGASDMILLPTVFREVMQISQLGFQIVHGLSSVSEDGISIIEHESPRTLFLVDSDKGGSEIMKKLTRAGVDKSRIFTLPYKSKGYVLEDFIVPEVYIFALNEEFRRSHGESIQIKGTDLTLINSPASVTSWCKTKKIKQPNKGVIANHILEFKNKNPDKPIIQSKYKTVLKKLFSDLDLAFKNIKISS